MKTNYIPRVTSLDQPNIMEVLVYIEDNKNLYGFRTMKDFLKLVNLRDTEYSAAKKGSRTLSEKKLQPVVDYLIRNFDVNPDYIKSKKLPIVLDKVKNEHVVNEFQKENAKQNLQLEIEHLKELLAAKDKQILLQDEIIAQLKRLIKED